MDSQNDGLPFLDCFPNYTVTSITTNRVDILKTHWLPEMPCRFWGQGHLWREGSKSILSLINTSASFAGTVSIVIPILLLLLVMLMAAAVVWYKKRIKG